MMLKKMEKIAEGVMTEGLGHSLQQRVIDVAVSVSNGVKTVLYDWGILIAVIGFLLGRAMILGELTPFMLPFLATVFVLRKAQAAIAALALIGGSLLSHHGQWLFAVVGMVVFLLMYKGVKRLFDQSAQALPYVVFAATMLARLGIVFVLEGGLSQYTWMMATVEAGLSFLLTMIFLQSIPLITGKRGGQALKNEEIICLIILLASVMTGTVGWVLYDVTMQHSIARYLVLIFALVGGATIGATVGVVTGLILSLASVASLYQMSLLAFAGLLGGLMKEGKRIGVATGMLVGTLLIGMYAEGGTGLASTVAESAIAIGVFLLTPRSWLVRIASYIPGTTHHAHEQQQYLRKVRDATAGRVERFSSLFQTLAMSFKVDEDDAEEKKAREIDLVLSHVTEKTCQLCPMKEKCWVDHVDRTYDVMQKMMWDIEQNGAVVDMRLKRQWRSYCRKPDQVITAMNMEMSQYNANQVLQRQVLESRKLVSEQLAGVSKVMGDFAGEIQKEKQPHVIEEEFIMDALFNAGLEVGHIDVCSVASGRIEIEMSVKCTQGAGQAEKVIAPMLSDLLNETIVLKREEPNFYSNGYHHISLGSTNPYVVETGVAKVAKGGEWLSGDNYATIELNSEKFAVAISDGMGNGERAYLQSRETLQLLQEVLQSGIEETVAIKSVNSILSLRNTEDMFATLDLAMIDLQDARATFLKIASTPSFIKRGKHVAKVEAGNLPIGIIQDVDVDVVQEQLKPGDLLVMVSDGILDAKRHIENKELWLRRLVTEIETSDPQEVADMVLEQVIRSERGLTIDDDMTVIVTRVERHTPKWSSIPIHPKARRHKRMNEHVKRATGT